MKMACPGLVRALAVSPDCVYCAGAIADKIHIWQVMVEITLLLTHMLCSCRCQQVTCWQWRVDTTSRCQSCCSLMMDSPWCLEERMAEFSCGAFSGAPLSFLTFPSLVTLLSFLANSGWSRRHLTLVVSPCLTLRMFPWELDHTHLYYITPGVTTPSQ